MAFSERELPAALCVIDQHLMCIAVHNQDTPVGSRRHAVHIGDLSLGPALEELTVGPERHNRRIGSLPDVHDTFAVDCNIAEKPELSAPRVISPSFSRERSAGLRAPRSVFLVSWE